MQRYFLYIAYNGSNYHGWQIQPNGNSIQEELNKAISTLLRSDIYVVGAGRTDSGVHAREMVAHFDTTQALSHEFVRRLNGILPADIAATQLVATKPEAHARFSALAREYQYHVCTAKNPFLQQYAHRVIPTIDFELMNKAAEKLFDYTDFTSFSKLHTDTKTNLCTITKAVWEERGEEWVFTIEANRFLRNMVRAIVGTLLNVGNGCISIDDFCRIIEKKDRGAASASAPAKALFLTKVTYPEDIFL